MKCLVSIIVVVSIASANSPIRIRHGDITIAYDSLLYSRIVPAFSLNSDFIPDFQPAEAIWVNGKKYVRFQLEGAPRQVSAHTTRVTGVFHQGPIALRKIIDIRTDPAFPAVLQFQIFYVNIGATSIMVDGWEHHAYRLQPAGDDPPFWSYQSGSYEDRFDWITPLHPGFYRENYMGMNATDYGGGTPVVDVWRRDGGLAIGHVDLFPRLVSLPVDYRDSTGVRIGIVWKHPQQLAPGDTLRTLPTFVAVHQGDCFTPLRTYRQLLEHRGLRFASPVPTAYEPIWCAWGYERDFTVEQVLNTIPKVKELGLEWVVIDDGWQTAEGDWYLNPQKFPGGNADMKRLVDTIHRAGLKAKLWWTPLAADPGTDLLKNHPDLLLLNKDGNTRLITWWDSKYLCPAYAKTIEYTQKLVQKFIGEWGFDGLKIDGQHLNGVPPCYNPVHHHAYPEESVEKLPEFFKMIYKTATALKPAAVVEICACGTAASVYNMAYMNQPVASDPLSSWQIRHRAKVYKALMGPDVAYYGDHVELSDGFDDFASTVGVGGVIGTKFTLPGFGSDTVQLTAQRQQLWQKWIRIYKQHLLPSGMYRGELYDIGYDRPETHVIQKGDTLFYAFYATEYHGTVEFRGLQSNKTYQVWDYVNQKLLGIVKGTHPQLRIAFQHYLLMYVVPVGLPLKQ